MRSRKFVAFALAASTYSVIASSETTRPRGVAPEYAKYYKHTKLFSCIFNPDIVLDADQVNDDFCDCPDGSDEPGTSACSNLSPLSPPSVATSDPNLNHTAALPGYYCKNKGHVGSYVPFTYVNDGVCDYELCCDGSDEWSGVGGVKCEDRCKDIGAEWKKGEATRQRTRNAAMRERKELVVEAQKIRKEIEEKIVDYRVLLVSDEERIKDAEKELVEVENQEKLKVVRAPKTSGKLGMLVSLAQNRINELKSTMGQLKEEKLEAEGRVRQLEELLEKFKVDYNPNFNDEGVKRAVRAWEDYDAAGRLSTGDWQFEQKLDSQLADDSEHGIVWEDYEQGEADTSILYSLEEYLPVSLKEWMHVKLNEFRALLVENGILAAQEIDGTESKVVSDAKSRLNSVTIERDNRKRDIKSSEEDLEKDYGPDEIFRALKSQCVETESGEYKYEFCFMGQTTQKSKNGGMNTNMGNFDRIETIFVDEEEAIDGKGLGSGDRLALQYENGAHCWNGPARRTTVILACAENNEIWKVIEAEKCVYRLEGGSPAACVVPSAHPAPKEKDEL